MKTLSLLFVFFLLLTIACKNDKSTLPQNNSYMAAGEQVPLYHIERDVLVKVSGYLRAWRKAEISLPDSTLLLSLLYEKGARVKKGNLLASLWKLPHRDDFTPIDILAPLGGIITSQPFKVQTPVPANAVLMIIENFDKLLLQAEIMPGAAKIIKSGNKVQVETASEDIYGRVDNIDKVKRQINILFDNREGRLSPDIYVEGYVFCKNIRGDFLPRRCFRQSRAITVSPEEQVELNISEIAVWDTLSLIYPAMPDQNNLKIIKKRLDLTH